jgi:hypothetical protein
VIATVLEQIVLKDTCQCKSQLSLIYHKVSLDVDIKGFECYSHLQLH